MVVKFQKISCFTKYFAKVQLVFMVCVLSVRLIVGCFFARAIHGWVRPAIMMSSYYFHHSKTYLALSTYFDVDEWRYNCFPFLNSSTCYYWRGVFPAKGQKLFSCSFSPIGDTLPQNKRQKNDGGRCKIKGGNHFMLLNASSVGNGCPY